MTYVFYVYIVYIIKKHDILFQSVENIHKLFHRLRSMQKTYISSGVENRSTQDNLPACAAQKKQRQKRGVLFV